MLWCEFIQNTINDLDPQSSKGGSVIDGVITWVVSRHPPLLLIRNVLFNHCSLCVFFLVNPLKNIISLSQISLCWQLETLDSMVSNRREKEEMDLWFRCCTCVKRCFNTNWSFIMVSDELDFCHVDWLVNGEKKFCGKEILRDHCENFYNIVMKVGRLTFRIFLSI